MPITSYGPQYPYTADADLPPYQIAKYGTIDGNCAIAGAATDKLLGVTENVPVPAGQVASICTGGQPLMTYGGPVNAGDFLTSDGNGNAISIASGATAMSVGQALETGVSGDIRPIRCQVGRVTAS